MKKEVVGYVIKVGDEYAIGFVAQRTRDRRKAFVFRKGDGLFSRTAREFAVRHMQACHPDGRIVRIVRRVKP